MKKIIEMIILFVMIVVIFPGIMKFSLMSENWIPLRLILAFLSVFFIAFVYSLAFE